MTGKKHDRSELFSKPDLKERGWTDALIKRFLAEPDDTRDNPHYKKAPPMLFYKIDRVEATELTEEFAAARAKSAQRKESSKKAVKTKRELIKQYASMLPPVLVPSMGRTELIRHACEHYNDHWSDYNQRNLDRAEKHASEHDNEEFLNRIVVNYLRHRLTDYEKKLSLIRGYTGNVTAAAIIKNKVLEAIGQTYSWLADECENQKVDPEGREISTP